MNYKKVLNVVKKLQISIIDINMELFSKHNDPLNLFPFRTHGHYNEEGYELVAKKILERIK